ncbi:DNA polymerase III subunit epsilon [Thalassobaculum fulvum]|uniref:DNA polymerase III subunit epsilon n=1 Tax=Thalassobaculum fulvum TaxID=1633335 RepID=A0A918XNN8_9PROT|nr:DNA polymerase III subunit epsilon [Thalassobaculum fulvum]GHD39699.1 DNA polymerase III subunit epsilon [Thalassobaculum fulvum]
MREIVLDTETTGLDPETGDRIVEIGCLELINHVPTGRTLHHYINPERDMPQAAFEVHGLSTEFLSGYPVFAALADEIVEFLGDAVLVIHNAAFDMKFINSELRRLGRPEIPMSQALDTVQLARRKYPGAQVSLDALCRRFEIDNGHRTLHGALLDADLLAAVYLELIGGRQPDLALATEAGTDGGAAGSRTVEQAVRPYREPRPHAPSAEELAAHRAFLESLKEPLWLAAQPAG